MMIEVNAVDILTGTKGHCCTCPVAIALSRYTHLNVFATYKSIEFWSDMDFEYTQTYEYKLPKKVKKFMKRFDEGLSVKPFTFRLDV